MSTKLLISLRKYTYVNLFYDFKIHYFLPKTGILKRNRTLTVTLYYLIIYHIIISIYVWFNIEAHLQQYQTIQVRLGKCTLCIFQVIAHQKCGLYFLTYIKSQKEISNRLHLSQYVEDTLLD